MTYACSADARRIDGDVVWRYLSQEAYWERWRTRADVDRQLAAAWRLVGCYCPSGDLVGFARSVSDGVAFGYLADVFVLPEHRGRGLALRVVTAVVADPPAARFQWLLHTTDAHGLYAKLGFESVGERLMQRRSLH